MPENVAPNHANNVSSEARLGPGVQSVLSPALLAPLERGEI